VACIVNAQITPVELIAIHAFDGIGRIAFIVETDKTETARVSSVAISWHIGITDFTVSFELASKCFGRCSIGQIVDLE